MTWQRCFQLEMFPHLDLLSVKDHTELPVCFLDMFESAEDSPHMRRIGEPSVNVGYVYDKCALPFSKQTTDILSDGIGKRIWVQEAPELAGVLNDCGCIPIGDSRLEE